VPLTFLAFWRGTFLVLAFERVAEIFLSTFCTWFPKLLHVVRHHGIVASFADIAEKHQARQSTLSYQKRHEHREYTISTHHLGRPRDLPPLVIIMNPIPASMQLPELLGE